VTDCRFCRGEAPRADHKVAELSQTIAYLHDDQFFPGWTILVLKRHAAELFELTADERARMMDDVTKTAAALRTIWTPRKINYELLGNQVPHLHWHLFPRSREDPEALKPVWLALDRAERDEAERRRLETGPVDRAATLERLRRHFEQAC
jgi:diadenosine tetraphosphate (Ap4A) HIT family hydrolase